MAIRHNLPSVKTLRTIAYERAKELRQVLELTERSKLEELLKTDLYPVTRDWYRQCYHPMSFQTAKLSIASEIIPATYGVEYQSAGKGKQSPAFEYCNAGDSYRATLMYVSGRGYKVMCWGDLVERGNYE
jgi:hypothetical protein